MLKFQLNTTVSLSVIQLGILAVTITSYSKMKFGTHASKQCKHRRTSLATATGSHLRILLLKIILLIIEKLNTAT